MDNDKNPPPKECNLDKEETVEDKNSRPVGDTDVLPVEVPSDAEIPPSDSWAGWISKNFESAKNSSNEMFQYLRQDFTEFGESIQEAAHDLKEKLNLEENARAAKSAMEGTVSTIMDNMSYIFGVKPEYDTDSEYYIDSDGRRELTSQVEKKLEHMVWYDDFYDIAGDMDPEDFAAWTAKFDLSSKSKEEIDGWFHHIPKLMDVHSEAVPSKVTDEVFWSRFYYKLHGFTKDAEQHLVNEAVLRVATSIEEQSIKREKIETTIPEASCNTLPIESETILHISEEDQKRLLSEYEEEMKLLGRSGTASGHHSRRSSEHLSTSSSGSYAFVTQDPITREPRVD